MKYLEKSAPWLISLVTAANSQLQYMHLDERTPSIISILFISLISLINVPFDSQYFKSFTFVSFQLSDYCIKIR